MMLITTARTNGAEASRLLAQRDVATILGRPPRNFEQFALDYAAAFSPTLVAR